MQGAGVLDFHNTDLFVFMIEMTRVITFIAKTEMVITNYKQ